MGRKDGGRGSPCKWEEVLLRINTRVGRPLGTDTAAQREQGISWRRKGDSPPFGGMRLLLYPTFRSRKLDVDSAN